jgi:hypothetical protein
MCPQRSWHGLRACCEHAQTSTTGALAWKPQGTAAGQPLKGGTLQDKNQLIRCLALRVMSSIRVHVIVQLVVLAIRKVAPVSPCCGAIGPRQGRTGTAAVWRQYSVAVGLPRHLQRACYIVSGPIVRTRRGRAARTNSCHSAPETRRLTRTNRQHSYISYSSLTTVQRWASVAQPSFSGWHSDAAQRACVGAALLHSLRLLPSGVARFDPECAALPNGSTRQRQRRAVSTTLVRHGIRAAL